MKKDTIYKIFRYGRHAVNSHLPLGFGDFWTLARYDGQMGNKNKGARPKRFVMMASNVPKNVSVPIEQLNDILVLKDIKEYHMVKVPLEDLPLYIDSAHMYPEFDRVLEEQA